MPTGQDKILGTDTVRDALKIKVNDDIAELFATKSEVEAARDGYVSLLEKEKAQDAAILAVTGANGSLVSSNDTTPGFLNGKLVAGEGVTLTEKNDGGNESLTISVGYTIQDNILLNAFRIAINGSLSRFGMVDGTVDEFENENALDFYKSAGVQYFPTNDYCKFDGTLRHYNDWYSNSYYSMYSGNNEQIGMAITIPVTTQITSIYFYLGSYGAPTGYMYAKIYAATGIVGQDAIPTGEVLATSDAVAAPKYSWTEFSFSTPFNASPGDYCILLEYTSGDSIHYVRAGVPASPYHGNGFHTNTAGSGWTPGLGIAYKVYGTGDALLIPTIVTAETQPDSCRLVLLEQDIDAITVGTDLKAYVSRDGGTTFTEVILTDEGDYETSKRILAGTADISGQPAGTSMVWKVENANGKAFYLHGVGMLWD